MYIGSNQVDDDIGNEIDFLNYGTPEPIDMLHDTMCIEFKIFFH